MTDNEKLMLECLEAQFKYYVDKIGVDHSQAVLVRNVLTTVKGYDPLVDFVVKQTD
jgi:hypothetical protein